MRRVVHCHDAKTSLHNRPCKISELAESGQDVATTEDGIVS